MKQYARGFTIVELLIVIIVIGILASISVVTYRGSQERAEYARAQTDIKNIDDALTIYKAQKGAYPIQLGFVSASSALEDILVPGYLDKASILTAKTGYGYAYATNATGTDYALLRFRGTNIYPSCLALPSVETSGNPLLKTSGTVCPNQAWGYWTTGAASW